MRLQCQSCNLEFESAAAPPYARCARCNSDQVGAPFGAWGAPAAPAAQPGGWPGAPPPGYGPPQVGYTQPQGGYGFPGGPSPPMGMMPTPQGAPLDTQTMQIASILVLLFCCQPAGIFALVWLEEAKKQHNQGNLEVAQKKLNEAKIALVVGPVLGGVLFFLYVIVQIIANVH